eukprot:14764100-Ditylum_brightwellii.AAC.1
MILEKENNLVIADQNDSAREKEFEFKTTPILNATGIKTSEGGQKRPYNSAVSTRCEGKQGQVWASKGDWNESPKVFLLHTKHKKEDCKKSVVTVSTTEDRRVDEAARACDRQEVCQMHTRHDEKVTSKGSQEKKTANGVKCMQQHEKTRKSMSNLCWQEFVRSRNLQRKKAEPRVK